MDLHANAALSWSGRRELARRVVEQGWTLSAAAGAAGVSMRCARKWVGRYRAGDDELRDRSSAPRLVANRTPADRVAVIVLLRQLRMTAAEIAETLAMPLSTVSVVLKRQGMGRLGRIGLEQPVRYERSRPGELVHIDVKKLGRIVGGAGKRVAGHGNSPYNPQRTDAAGKVRNILFSPGFGVERELYAGLVEDLSSHGYVVVAIDHPVPKATLAALAKNRAQLKAVLLYHVVKGNITAAQASMLTSAKTLEGASVPIRVSGTKVYIGGAQVVKADVKASNGVIHVINKVLIPPKQ